MWRQGFSIKSGCEQSKRIHGLVEPKSLDVGPFQDARALVRHSDRIEQCFDGDVLGGRHRFDQVDQLAELNSCSRNDHRLGLNAPHPIDTLLRWNQCMKLINGKVPRFLNKPIYGK